MQRMDQQSVRSAHVHTSQTARLIPIRTVTAVSVAVQKTCGKRSNAPNEPKQGRQQKGKEKTMSKKRGQNEGSIYQMKDGRWRATVSVGWKNGQRVRKTFSAPTRKAV